MKRFIIVLVSVLTVTLTYAHQKVYNALGTSRVEVSTQVRVGDFWAENWNRNVKLATTISQNSFVMVIYPVNDEPWNPYCKVTLKDFTIPDKKAIKAHQKNNKFWYYSCDVEFYYNVQYPSVEECFANYGGFMVNAKDAEAKKRTIEAKVFLNPYFFTAGNKFGDTDDKDMYFNIWFDNVALRVWMRDHLTF